MKAMSRTASRVWLVCLLERTVIVTALFVTLAALTITAFVHGSRPSGAQERAAATSVPSTPTVPLFIPRDSVELSHFAFGYLEFDWNPANGVPGFELLAPRRAALIIQQQSARGGQRHEQAQHSGRYD